MNQVAGIVTKTLRTRTDPMKPCHSCRHITERAIKLSVTVYWECVKCGHLKSRCEHERATPGYGKMKDPDWDKKCRWCGEILKEG